MTSERFDRRWDRMTSEEARGSVGMELRLGKAQRPGTGNRTQMTSEKAWVSESMGLGQREAQRLGEGRYRTGVGRRQKKWEAGRLSAKCYNERRRLAERTPC